LHPISLYSPRCNIVSAKHVMRGIGARRTLG
jgi:hypothetical protein